MIPFWRKKHQEKKAFVLKNGGILLEQLIITFNGKRNPISNFSSKQLKSATNNYDTKNVMRNERHFKMYKGFLQDRQISVLKLKSNQKYVYDECINNIVFASQMCHKHILKLIGCCLETEVPILVFESLVKYGTLKDHILNHHKYHLETLSWRQRLKIAMEISHTFAYLHVGFPRPIVYSLMNPSHFLLDEHCVPKLIDFSAAQCIPEGETQIKDAQLRGIIGYIAPELFKGVLDEKCDVYGFGILLLEILSGQRKLDLIRSISETEDETETKDEDRKFFARVGDYWLRDFETGDENRLCHDFVKNINGENWFILVVDPTIIGDGLCPETRQQIQAFLELVEPDIRALSGLTGALDKKKALVMELKHTNNDLLERQNGAGGFAKDSESLKKHIATASSALHHVRQRNTYPEILLPPWLKAPANSSLVGNQAGYLDNSYVAQESGSAVVEIVKDSRLKARTMVDTAIKAVSSIKEGEDAVNGIRQTLEYTDNRQMTSDSRVPAIRSPEQDGTKMRHKSLRSLSLRVYLRCS